MAKLPDNVIPLPCVTKLELPVTRVLQEAIDNAELEGIVILGYRKDGNEYFASTYSDGGTVLWLMERLKVMLLEIKDLAESEPADK